MMGHQLTPVVEAPVAFHSVKMNDTKRGYGQIDKGAEASKNFTTPYTVRNLKHITATVVG